VKVLVDSSVAKDHLDFAARLLDLSAPSKARRREWDSRIGQARDRLADARYYLVIAGEFNAGKSTFINALLEAELFASGPRATTAASVRIWYGDRLTVRVGFRDGKSWSGADSSAEPRQWRKVGRLGDQQRFAGLTAAQVRVQLGGMDIVEALRVVTTDGQVAPMVTSVEVEYPSALLGTGLVLIDTPGAGSGEEKHAEEHAMIARREVSAADLAVVLSRQDHVLPQSMAEFLRDALDEGLLARCVFVVTSADQADPDEFREACGAATERISALLKITDPAVVWAAPIKVVRSLRGDPVSEQDSLWLERFDRTRRWLRRVAETRRPAAVADTALRIVHELLNELDGELKSEIGLLEQQQRELAATVPTDMAEFLSDQVDHGIRALNDAEQDALDRVGTLTWSARDDVEEAIRDKIMACRNGGEIRRVANEELGPVVNSELRYLARTGSNATSELLNDRLTEVSADLRAAFAAEFAKLEQIDAAPSAKAGGDLQVIADTVGRATFEAAAALAAQDSHRDAVSVGGGAAMGAVIGTMFFPVVGTFIGAALGALFGGMRVRPISAVQEEAIAEVTPKALGYVDDTGDQLTEHAGDVASEARGELRRQAGWYRSTYEAAVQALNEANDTRRHALRDRHALLSKLRREATTRRAAVMADRIQLRSVDRIDISDPFGGSDA
jgi:hypothetical protein